VSRLAFGTLPPALRTLYGVEVGRARRAAMDVAFAAARTIRPLLPDRFRFIAPYQEWLAARDGKPSPVAAARARGAGRVRTR
jgi:uncharacterized protein (DUF2236 family)